MKDIEKDSPFIRENISTARGRYCSVGVSILLATSLVACGGGGGSSGGGKVGSPSTFSVTSVSPEEGDTGVELDATLKASFNRDLLASSATEDSDRVLLKKSSGLQETSAPVSVSIDTASSLIIQPDTPLDILSEYTVTVTSDITDNSGRPLSDEHHWRFVTRDGDWEQDERLDDGSAPDIAVDGEGNGWALWLSGDSGHEEVVGRFYSATDGAWSSSNRMFGSPTIIADASKPRIAIDRASGDAIAVWIQDEKVYARYRDAGSAAGPGVGWGAMEQISTATPVYNRTFLKVAFSAGRAMAVWAEGSTGSTITLIGSTFLPGTDPVWREKTGPELELKAGESRYADFAIDYNGNALLVWLKNEPTHPDRDNRVSVTRYDAVTQNWATTSIEQGVGYAADPKVAFDSDGNAFAAWWRHSDDFFGRLYVGRYDVASGAWDSSRIMGAREDSEGRYPSIAVDPQGNAMVAFEIGEPYVARYNADEGAWGEAQEIGDYGGTVLTDVVIDRDGNATVVWRKGEGTGLAAKNIFSNRYTAVTDSWGVATRVETGGGADAERPVINNADWNHSAITVWEDAGSIYTNRFSAE